MHMRQAIEALWVSFAAAAVIAVAGCAKSDERNAVGAATAALQKNQPKAAVIILKTALQSSPSSAEARFLLGRALLEDGDAPGAAIELRRALELQHPEELVAPLLAEALVSAREYSKVIAQYRSAEFVDPEAASKVQIALATAYAAQGSMAEANRAAERALAGNPQSSQVQLGAARIRAAAGDTEGAISVLDALALRDPNNAAAWRLRGDILQRVNADQKGAVEAYEKSLATKPDQPEVHAALLSMHFMRLDEQAVTRQFEAMKAALPKHPLTRLFDAQTALVRGENRRAHDELRELLSAAPDNPMLLYLAGAAELQLNMLTQAEAHLQRAVELQPQFAGARLVLARVHLRARAPERAVAVLQPLVGNPKADAETLGLAAQARLLAGDTAGANALFARAGALKPSDTSARTALAIGQVASGQRSAALAELERIAATDKGVTADMALISLRLGRREHDAALKAIDALEKKQPTSPIAADLRGRVHMQRKDLAAARKAYEQALSRDTRYLPALNSLALLDVAEKKPGIARARYEALVKADPRNVPALLSLAEFERGTGGTREQVERRIRDAIAADPQDARSHLVLIDYLRGANDHRAVLAAAQAAAAALPDSGEIQDKLARAQLASGDENQAAATFGRLASQHSGLLYGHLGMAELSLGRKDFDAASRFARRALEVAPRSPEAQRAAIHAAMGQKRPAEALLIARDVQKHRPQDALGFILEGEIELTQKRWDAAIAAFRKATSLPSPGQSPARLHHTLVQANRLPDASQFADRWLAQHPSDVLFGLYLAGAAAAQGDVAQADRRYQEVLKKQPANSLALNNLAALYTQHGKPGASALAQRAVDAAPNQPAFLDTLAQALAAEGDVKKALAVQKQATALAPKVPVFQVNLAKIHIRAGDRAAAITTLERLKGEFKQYPEQAEVETLLRSLGKS